MSYNATHLIHRIPVDPLTGSAAVPICQASTFVQKAPSRNKRFRNLFAKDKRLLEKISLTFNCSFMTQNIWLQLSKPTNFIGNYYGAEQITYHSCFIQKMYLLPLLYAARHTLIFLQRSSTFIYNYPFSRLTRF